MIRWRTSLTPTSWWTSRAETPTPPTTWTASCVAADVIVADVLGFGVFVDSRDATYRPDFGRNRFVISGPYHPMVTPDDTALWDVRRQLVSTTWAALDMNLLAQGITIPAIRIFLDRRRGNAFGAAAVPPCVLPAAASAPPSSGHPPSAARPPALISWPRFSRQYASRPVWPPSASLSSARLIFPAALAFLTAAHRLFVAAMIRARPSGLRRRFFLLAFAGAGVAAGITRRLGRRSPATTRCASSPARCVERERDRPFEAPRPGDEHPDAARKRFRGDRGFVRLRGTR